MPAGLVGMDGELIGEAVGLGKKDRDHDKASKAGSKASSGSKDGSGEDPESKLAQMMSEMKKKHGISVDSMPESMMSEMEEEQGPPNLQGQKLRKSLVRGNQEKQSQARKEQQSRMSATRAAIEAEARAQLERERREKALRKQSKDARKKMVIFSKYEPAKLEELLAEGNPGDVHFMLPGVKQQEIPVKKNIKQLQEKLQ